MTGESAPDDGGNSVSRETAPVGRLAIMNGRDDTPLTGDSAPDDGCNSMFFPTGESASDNGGDSMLQESVHQCGQQLLLRP